MWAASPERELQLTLILALYHRAPLLGGNQMRMGLEGTSSSQMTSRPSYSASKGRQRGCSAGADLPSAKTSSTIISCSLAAALEWIGLGPQFAIATVEGGSATRIVWRRACRKNLYSTLSEQYVETIISLALCFDAPCPQNLYNNVTYLYPKANIWLIGTLIASLWYFVSSSVQDIVWVVLWPRFWERLSGSRWWPSRRQVKRWPQNASTSPHRSVEHYSFGDGVL